MLLVLEDVAVPHVFVVFLARVEKLHVRCPRAGRHVERRTAGRSNFMITVMTSPGCILTVSFQPSSSGSGPRRMPGGCELSSNNSEWLP